VVEAIVQWFMKGFERIIPGDAWARSLPVEESGNQGDAGDA
jgi:hypothetical protein